MAQLDAMKRYVKSSSSGPSEQTMDQLLHGDDYTRISPTSGKNHELEDQGKKSVLTRVKEKAKKLRNSFNKKKQGQDDVSTPTSGNSLEEEDCDGVEDDERKDSEYYGAPMYESVKAPEDVKETAKHHPRDDVVIAEKHVLPSSFSPKKELVREEDKNSTRPTESITEKVAASGMNAKMTIAECLDPKSAVNTSNTKTESHSPQKAVNTSETLSSSDAVNTSNRKTESHSPLKAINTSKTTTESLAPQGAKTTSKATSESLASQGSKVTSKRTSGSVSPQVAKNTSKTSESLATQEAKNNNSRKISDSLAPLEAMNTNKTITESVTETLGPAYAKASESVTETLGPAYAKASETTQMVTSKIQDMAFAKPETIATKDEPSSNETKWDKGVSVKEYLMQKFEPGEEEKALSKVISEAMSPTKKPGDKTVVEKVRGVVTSLLATNESSSSMPEMKKSTSMPASKSANVPAMNKSATIAATNKASRMMAANKSTNMPATNKSADMSTTNRSAHMPVSTNAYEIEEKTEGRILQTN